MWGSRVYRVEGGGVESVGVESVQGGRWRSGECGDRECAGWKVESRVECESGVCKGEALGIE